MHDLMDKLASRSQSASAEVATLDTEIEECAKATFVLICPDMAPTPADFRIAQLAIQGQNYQTKYMMQFCAGILSGLHKEAADEEKQGL